MPSWAIPATTLARDKGAVHNFMQGHCGPFRRNFNVPDLETKTAPFAFCFALASADGLLVSPWQGRPYAASGFYLSNIRDAGFVSTAIPVETLEASMARNMVLLSVLLTCLIDIGVLSICRTSLTGPFFRDSLVIQPQTTYRFCLATIDRAPLHPSVRSIQGICSQP